mmetsp:Transcript_38588/g.56340  ORF Transcript_38588/g.56340 Transcript_38588/m.56340 type:complete len:217 (-) Transcript_38588:89-739(-)
MNTGNTDDFMMDSSTNGRRQSVDRASNTSNGSHSIRMHASQARTVPTETSSIDPSISSVSSLDNRSTNSMATLNDALKATNGRLDNAQMSLQTLQWQLKYATDRIQLLTEERRRMEIYSNALMAEKRELEEERHHLAKQSRQDQSRELIENLTKKGERLRAERDRLKSKERKRMIAFVTTTIEVLAYCVAVGCVVKKVGSWNVTREFLDYVANASS